MGDVVDELDDFLLDLFAMFEFLECVFRRHCYAHFGIVCTCNGDCLLRDGSGYGIEDRFGISCLISSSKGSCLGLT